LDTVDQQHGGMQAYLQGPVGLDSRELKGLRDWLLQP